MAASASAGSVRILLLEDSPRDIESIAGSLQRVSPACSLHSVASREAFAAALGQDSFDLILADDALAGFDGMAALRMAAEACPGTPFVFLSGAPGEEAAVEALKRGAAGCVPKQRLDRLRGTVLRVLAEAREQAAPQELDATPEMRIEERMRDLATLNAALKESEARCRAMLDHCPESICVIVVTPEGRLVYEAGNPATAALFGICEEEARGREIDGALVGPNGDRFRACIAGRRPVQFESVAGGNGGPVYRETILTPVADETGRVARIIGTTRDVTMRKEAEAAFRQAQKMEALGRLTSGMAHDFNNLLTAVLSNLELVERSLGADHPHARRWAGLALQGAEQAAALTRRLLAFGRHQPLSPVPADVNALVAEMSDLFLRTLGEPVSVEMRLCADLWRTRVDPDQLENVLLNLALNARDAMPEGGRFVIETANVRLDGPPGVAGGGESGDHVRIAVTDTGTGMPQEVLARALEPFFTTKEAGRGAGLGLSQAHGFVEQSGGRLSIRSTPGKGTRVEIHLPRLGDADRAGT